MSKFQYQNGTKSECHQWLGLNLLKLTSFLGIIPKVFQTKFHHIRITKSKVIHVQIPVPKWEKRKSGKTFWITKRDNERITNRNNFRDFNTRQKDYRLGQNFKPGQRDFKMGQIL